MRLTKKEKLVLYEVLSHCLDHNDWMRSVFDPGKDEPLFGGEHMESAQRKLATDLGLLLDSVDHKDHLDSAYQYERDKREH